MINDPVKFCAGLWNWDILAGCFGDTHIRPMDIEGTVERNGRFLYIETKAPGAYMPLGEDIYYRNRVGDGLSTVFVVWGDTNVPEEIQIYLDGKVTERRPCDLDGFRDLVSRWYRWVDVMK